MLDAFAAETAELAAVMLDVAPADWSRASPCPPWTVAELLGHVATVIGWLPGMLAAPAPPRAEVSAAGYYRADDRFSPATNAARLDLAARRAAAASDGHALALAFHADQREIVGLCRREPADRVVGTRHGDAMSLTDFLVTRIVEVGVHGLDLADGLGRPAWLTPAAAGVLTDLFLGDGGRATGRRLGWDDPTLLRKVTGRRTLTDREAAGLRRPGVRRLTLG
nr:maleylpyruvate isomerase family mycothiol-dependent enzyme [Actinoplanes sp. ATCC 53533]